MSVRDTVKSLLLPRGAAYRRLPLGVAAGVTMKIDFAHQTTLYLGLYEVELSPHVRRLVRHGSAPVVVERRRRPAGPRPAGHNRWLVCEGKAP